MFINRLRLKRLKMKVKQIRNIEEGLKSYITYAQFMPYGALKSTNPICTYTLGMVHGLSIEQY